MFYIITSSWLTTLAFISVEWWCLDSFYLWFWSCLCWYESTVYWASRPSKNVLSSLRSQDSAARACQPYEPSPFYSFSALGHTALNTFQDSVSLMLMVDTGASCFISSHKVDFDPCTLHPSSVLIKDLSGTSAVAGSGTICWQICTSDGQIQVLYIESFCIPSALAILSVYKLSNIQLEVMMPRVNLNMTFTYQVVWFWRLNMARLISHISICGRWCPS